MKACLQKSIWSGGRLYSQIQKYSDSQVTLSGRNFNGYVEQFKKNRTAKNGKS